MLISSMTDKLVSFFFRSHECYGRFLLCFWLSSRFVIWWTALGVRVYHELFSWDSVYADLKTSVRRFCGDSPKIIPPYEVCGADQSMIELCSTWRYWASKLKAIVQSSQVQITHECASWNIFLRNFGDSVYTVLNYDRNRKLKSAFQSYLSVSQ